MSTSYFCAASSEEPGCGSVSVLLDDELRSAGVEAATRPPEKATAGLTLELMKFCRPDRESMRVVGSLEARVMRVAFDEVVGTQGAVVR